MNRLKRIINKAKAFIQNNEWLFVLLLVAVVVAVGLNHLSKSADKERQSRLSPEAARIVKEPQAWIKNPQDFNQFLAALDRGQLKTVATTYQSSKAMVLYTLKSGDRFSALVPGCSIFLCTALTGLPAKSSSMGFDLLSVDVNWYGTSERLLSGIEAFGNLLLTVAGFGMVFYFSMRLQVHASGEKLKMAERPEERFDDVIGCDSAKAALMRVGAFLKNPQIYKEIGARAPRGVLLSGPPGTGKTLLAKALAGETGANFIAVDGSFFTSMYYGLGVMKVKMLFKYARSKAPCILFIDEIDGIGRRNTGRDQSGGQSELNRIINRVLVEMDGFDPSSRVIVIGATNHEENIDAALRRAGRFDLSISIDPPTVLEREKLFKLYLAKVKTGDDVDAGALSRMTSGMSPADISNTVNKSASFAAEKGVAHVTQEHIVAAIESFQLGGDVNSVKSILTEESRRRLAYHEAGHALVANAVKSGRVERVSIEPRGKALGATYVSRESEEPLYAQGELEGQLAMLLGGREAELLVFKDISSGGTDDLKRATELSVSMVSTMGLSEKFGLLSLAGMPKELVGPDLQGQIRSEALVMLEGARATAVNILTEQEQSLHALATLLLASEVVSGEPLRAALSGEPVRISVDGQSEGSVPDRIAAAA